jgi:hypothetical protein
VEELILKQAMQLRQFEMWAEQHNWEAFHSAHYDWWMFPIDHPSRLGFAYTVYIDEVECLKANAVFMHNYLRGTELLMVSWGWDLKKVRNIDHPENGQSWHDWPIRLYKCAQSLKLFGREEELRSVLTYGRILLSQGKDFSFNGKDLSRLFLEE